MIEQQNIISSTWMIHPWGSRTIMNMIRDVMLMGPLWSSMRASQELFLWMIFYRSLFVQSQWYKRLTFILTICFYETKWWNMLSPITWPSSLVIIISYALNKVVYLEVHSLCLDNHNHDWERIKKINMLL